MFNAFESCLPASTALTIGHNHNHSPSGVLTLHCQGLDTGRRNIGPRRTAQELQWSSVESKSSAPVPGTTCTSVHDSDCSTSVYRQIGNSWLVVRLRVGICSPRFHRESGVFRLLKASRIPEVHMWLRSFKRNRAVFHRLRVSLDRWIVRR